MCIISFPTPKCNCLSLCRTTSALRPSAVKYIPLFHAVRPNISGHTDTTPWHDALDINKKGNYDNVKTFSRKAT